MPALPLLAVVGPTATGKSALGIDLAVALNGDVVNADSMQLYAGMDIGTAKVPPGERRGVAHHLLDIWHVRDTANVADYQRRAHAVLVELAAGGRPAVLVGGSGLYVRSVLDDLAFPGTDPDLRAALEAELTAVGSAVLHGRLARADPAAAAAILPSNGRRIVRALEVIALTGAPFTATLPVYRYARPSLQIGIEVSLAELDARVGSRVDAMFDAGLVAEVRSLLDRGLRDGPTASRALGYAQVTALLDGTITEAQARADTARATRRFARRQLSWFRRDPRIEWFGPGPALVSAVLERVRRTIDG